MGGFDGVLLERDDDLRTIAGQLDQACAGDGTSTVIEGPAGIGKTRLVDAAAQMGRERGMAVVKARGGVLEQELDFGVARQVLEGGLLAAGPDGLGSLETGPTAPAAAVLGTARPAPDAGPGHDPSADILRSLYWVTVNLAEAMPFLMMLGRRALGRRVVAARGRLHGPAPGRRTRAPSCWPPATTSPAPTAIWWPT